MGYDMYARYPKAAPNDTAETYFRFNIFGMQKVRETMEVAGMLTSEYRMPQDRDWPTLSDYLGERFGDDDADWDDYERASDAWDDPADPEHEDFKRHPSHGRFHTYMQVKAKVRDREHHTPVEGIPVHKLCSNDGWLVTPAECLAAVDAWYAQDGPHLRHALSYYAGLPNTGDDVEFMDRTRRWYMWLGFIKASAKRGGFRVH